MKGLICIDIDGTLTAVRERVPEETKRFLQMLVENDYTILFVTGRTFFWSMNLLHDIGFPYYLAVLNGAYIAHMPTHSLIAKQYLSHKTVEAAITLCQDADTGIVLYTGPERKEVSYLLPQFASEVLLRHLEARRSVLSERWEICKDCQHVPKHPFAALRAFCLPHTAKELAFQLQGSLAAQASQMTDSYDKSFSIVQLTHAKVNKGYAVDCVKKLIGKAGVVIACGDDYNDIPMLKIADYAVAMNTGPSALLELADVIAPAAEENGLIEGLKQILGTYL